MANIKYLSLDGLSRLVAHIRTRFGKNLSYTSSTTNGTVSLLNDFVDENTSTYGVLSSITIPSASTSVAGLMTAAQVTELNRLTSEEITNIVAGNGLTGGGSNGTVTLHVGAGTGISVAADSVSIKTASTGEIGGIKIAAKRTTTPSIASGGTTANRYYGVELDKNDKAFVHVPWTDTTSFTIGATAIDDDIVILSGTPGTNGVTYTVSHAKMFDTTTPTTTDKYTSGNGTTSISGSGGSGTIKIPQLTVDEYGHVKKASDESVTITMPTIPGSLKNPNKLTLTVGNNAAVEYDGSAAKSVEISLAKLGIPNVMQYQGQTATTQTMSDGSATATIALTTGNYTAKKGDVVIDSSSAREYIWNGSKWELFGIDSLSNYKIKQTAVSSPTASGTADAFIDTISQDANGNITVTKKNARSLSTATPVPSTATNAIVLSGLTVNNHEITTQQKTITAGSNITIDTSDARKIKISGTADTKVTSVGNHYTPSTESNTTKSAANGTVTNITNSTNGVNVVTGVTIDAAGHLTGVTSVALKSVDTDTHHQAKNVVTSSNTATANAAVTGNGVYLNLVENNTKRSSHKITGTGSCKVTSDANGNITISADTNTDTHHQAKNILTSSKTSTTAAAATSPYLNLVENGAVRSAIQIVGAGGTTVSGDANGKLTITSDSHTAITNGEIDALFGITAS